MDNTYLSKRELDVMNVLWHSDKALIASEIVDAKAGLTTPTVHTVLKKLMAKNYVEVADIVQSGKVLARSYRAVQEPDDYLKGEIETIFPLTEDQTTFSRNIVAALLNNAKDDEAVIDELEKLIQTKRGQK